MPTGIDAETNPGYQGARDLAMRIYSKLEPIREKFIDACLGTPYPNIPSQSISFPDRFLKGSYEATQIEGLRELVEQSLNLGLLFHLFRRGGPLPSPFLACGSDPTEDGLSCEPILSCR